MTIGFIQVEEATALSFIFCSHRTRTNSSTSNLILADVNTVPDTRTSENTFPVTAGSTLYIIEKVKVLSSSYTDSVLSLSCFPRTENMRYRLILLSYLLVESCWFMTFGNKSFVYFPLSISIISTIGIR